MDVSRLLTLALDEGDRRSLARALRLIEEGRSEGSEMLAQAWKRSGNAHIIGITGAPGAGKSTLVNSLISAWRALDRSVGVVAVDPSSPFTGGALLGDRIRMQEHIDDPGVFVRSMSSRGRLGGVADTTAGLVTMLDAAHFDPVVVETVGVGQSEVDVIDHADSVVVVINPGWGDSIQADKAGILEIGDIFVINKADRPDVAGTRRTLSAMLELGKRGAWVPPIIETVATEDDGILEMIDALDRHRRHLTVSDEGAHRRRKRVRSYVERAYTARAKKRLNGPAVDRIIDRVMTGSLDPWQAALMVEADRDPA